MKAADRIGAALLAALAIALYLWVVETSFPKPPRLGQPQDDDYTLLVHGFLKGRLGLDAPVPEALLKSANPYDPATRPPGVSVLHDASLYRGKYSLYFGAAPAVTLLLPWRLLTGNDLPLPYGVWLFASGGLLFFYAAFRRFRNRHYPAAGAMATSAGMLTLAFATLVLVLLRRGSMYEFAIAGGYFYFAVFLFCALESQAAPGRRGWALASGLALGLAVGSRPDYVSAAAVLAVPWLLDRRNRPKAAAALTAAAGFGAVLAVVAWYNWARYDNPFEFGMRYALTGIIEGNARHFSPANFPTNLYVYYLSPLRWGRYFPFVHGISRPAYPARYGQVDSAFGVLTNLPFSLFALVLLWPIRGRSAPDERLTASATSSGKERPEVADRVSGSSVVGVAHLSVVALLFCFYWAIIRYMTDFTPALMFAGAAGLLEAERRWGRWWPRLGLAAAAWCVLVSWLVCFQLYDRFEGSRPDLYRRVGRIFDAPVAVLESVVGTRPGPIAMTVDTPARAGASLRLIATGWSPRRDAVWLERTDPDHVRFGFIHGDGEAPVFSPPFAAGSGSVPVSIDAGSLYPPEEHPFFRNRSPGRIHHLKAWLRATCGTAPAWELPAEFFAASPGTVELPPEARAARRLAPGDEADAPWPLRAAEVRVRFTPDLAGRALPLVTTGRSGYGDVLRVTVGRDGQVNFGYDYWGKPGISSPAFPLSDGREHRIEFEIPAMLPEGATDSLRVSVDGRPVWTIGVRHHPTDPYRIFLGRNAIAATSCEPEFPGLKQ